MLSDEILKLEKELLSSRLAMSRLVTTLDDAWQTWTDGRSDAHTITKVLDKMGVALKDARDLVSSAGFYNAD